jgi:hypothetical protein
MSTERASVFENTPEFDVSEFGTKKPKPAEASASIEAIKAVSEAAQFPSREPVSAETRKSSKKREPRRYRTGRNVQFNVKISTSTHDGLYEISDKQGWVLGETLEKALAALKKEISAQK